VLGNAATHPGPLLSTALSRTGPYPQLAFASDVAAFVYSYVEATGGGPLLVGGEDGDGDESLLLPDVELLDDSLAEEAGAEERGGMFVDEVRTYGMRCVVGPAMLLGILHLIDRDLHTCINRRRSWTRRRRSRRGNATAWGCRRGSAATCKLARFAWYG
jgi:hypothetical protein